MKKQSFIILKKNRKYFSAYLLSNSRKYKCKIEINEYSENLAQGDVSLIVEDISVKTKYGTDLKFKVVVDAKKQEEAGVVTLKHFKFNSNLVESCRALGGSWDNESKSWIFSGFVEDKIEELDEFYNSDLSCYEITFIKDCFYEKSFKLSGYDVVMSRGRDDGIFVTEDVAILTGEKTRSGGSRIYHGVWFDKGCVIRLKLPLLVFESINIADIENFKIKKI